MPPKSTKAKRKGGPADEAVSLRALGAGRSERRYLPRTTPALALTVLAISLGSVLAGAGVYGLAFGGEGGGPSQKYAPALLAVGLAIVGLFGLFGKKTPQPVLVGDGGLAFEKADGELERHPFSAMRRVVVSPEGVRVELGNASRFVSSVEHPAAAAKLAAEARARIPARVEGQASALPAPDPEAGEPRPLDPPQIAGARCAKSGKTLSFEKDARLCGRCGELYHRASVPPRCLTCDAKLVA